MSLAASPGNARGAITVEFALILTVTLVFFGMVGELLRLSLVDQLLARHTHLAARAAATAPRDNDECETAIEDEFQRTVSVWMFDRDDDDDVSVGFERLTGDSWPATGTEEVRIAISWEASDDLGDGVDWENNSGSICGPTGSLLRLRSQVELPWYGPLRPFMPSPLVQGESWGRNARI